jgi:hypothetical protein
MLDSILAGPILRSTTPNRVCVWLALNYDAHLTLEVLTLDRAIVGMSKPDKLSASRFQVGKNLYVYLLQAHPTENQVLFATETLYYYRLFDEQANPPEINLKAAHLTYGEHNYPVFHIPNRLKSVLHGSCRKPHGGVGEDCLAVGDHLLAETYSDISQRPDLLLLTGDQIYADDVDASLLKVLREQAAILMGRSETLPLTEYDDPNQFVLTPDNIALGGRTKELIKHHAGITSSEAGNHLMSFGEFAAMYIYVFGNFKNWKTQSTWDEIKDSHIPLEEMLKWQDFLPWGGKLKWKDYLLGSGVNRKDKLIALKQAELENNIQKVAAFQESLMSNNVRRLLANISTYMIFDDHDVTDDWNISGHWYDTVRSSPLGRRIVSNALSAYWAFQGWGNDPDNFDSEMISAVTHYLNNSSNDPEGDELYDLLTWKHRGWSFSVATNPPIIAIDSRTQRQPDNAFYPTRLLDRYALDWLHVEWSKLKSCTHPGYDSGLRIDKNTIPLLIVTTPVFGFSPVEHIWRLGLWLISFVENIKLVSWLENLKGVKGFMTRYFVHKNDVETWTANLDGLTAFLDTLLHKMGIARCLFLSGDVHYSFTSVGSYKSKGFTGAELTIKCYQLTSSSLRNEPSDSQKKSLEKLVKLQMEGSLWHRFAWLFRRLKMMRGWELTQKLLPCIETNALIIEKCNLGEVKFSSRDGLPTHHILWQYPKREDSIHYLLPPI